jgi:N-acetylmuramoyl-L-alanine amidase
LIQFSACTETKIIYRDKVYYEIPAELKYPEQKNKFLNEYSKYISERKIFLDAGHGGSDRKNIGINKLVVEADINLNVVLFLKEFLIETGATVYLSRDTDTTVDLKLRSQLADSSRADIFISIHHNAPADSGDTTTNYTSTYYHATELDYEYNPCERDIARFIQRDLSYAMRNPGGLGSFDGTYSDYSVYPGKGFSVLRETNIPSVLVECGFHTNYYEEKRLSIEEFNRIEAWGIFRGLCRYFANSIPDIISSEEFSDKNNFSFFLKDDIGIETESIIVLLDKIKYNNFTYNIQTGLLTIIGDALTSGEHEIKIIVANKRGNHSFPFTKKIIINP